MVFSIGRIQLRGITAKMHSIEHTGNGDALISKQKEEIQKIAHAREF